LLEEVTEDNSGDDNAEMGGQEVLEEGQDPEQEIDRH